MKRVPLLLCLLIAGVLLVPAASATGEFYCSADVLVGGQGTAAEPWACVTIDQFNARVAEVCRTGGGTLYFLFNGGYVNYTVASDCAVVSGAPNPGSPNAGTPSPTTPPSAGGDTSSWLVTLAILAAGGLIAAGVVLRRASPPPP